MTAAVGRLGKFPFGSEAMTIISVLLPPVPRWVETSDVARNRSDHGLDTSTSTSTNTVPLLCAQSSRFWPTVGVALRLVASQLSQCVSSAIPAKRRIQVVIRSRSSCARGISSAVKGPGGQSLLFFEAGMS